MVGTAYDKKGTTLSCGVAANGTGFLVLIDDVTEAAG